MGVLDEGARAPAKPGALFGGTCVVCKENMSSIRCPKCGEVLFCKSDCKRRGLGHHYKNFCANPPAHFSNGDDEGSVESGEITSSSPPGKRHRKLPRDDDGDGGVSSSGWAASGFERTYKGRDHAAGDGPGGPGPGRRREVGRGERAWGIEGREERRATERGERTLEGPLGGEDAEEALVVDAGVGLSSDLVDAVLSPGLTPRGVRSRKALGQQGRGEVEPVRSVARALGEERREEGGGGAGDEARGNDGKGDDAKGAAEEQWRADAIAELKRQEALWRSVRLAPPERKWVPSPRPTPGLCLAPGEGGDIPRLTVVSWRLMTHASVVQVCGGRVPAHLAWEARTASVVHELRQWAPDVILIQDVEASAFAALERPLRGLGFQGIRVGSSGPGQAVFYKVSMFDLVHVRGCVANAILGRSPAQVVRARVTEAGDDNTDAPPTLWQELRANDQVAPFATIAILRHRPSSKPLACASLQLSPAGMQPDVAAVHADLVAWAVQAAAQGALDDSEWEGLPVVLGGDCCLPARIYRSHKFYHVAPNAPPFRPGVHELLQSGTLAPSHIDHPNVRRKEALLPPLETHGLSLFSCMAAADGGEEPPVTAMGPGPLAAEVRGTTQPVPPSAACASVDVVLATSRHFAVSRVLEMPYPVPASGVSDAGSDARDPSAHPVEGLEAMPGMRTPSNHFAIGVELAFRSNLSTGKG